MDYIEQIPSTDLMYGPGGNLLKVVIVPTPLDAQVVIEAGEYVPVNNVVYVPSGTSITYTVVKNGYISESDTVIVTKSQNIYVELEKEEESLMYGWRNTDISEDFTEAVQNTDLGSNNWFCSAYGRGKFVALGGDGYISTSEDGVNWTEAVQNLKLGSHGWKALAYNGFIFVALSGSGYVSTSEDGVNWTDAVQNENLGFHFWSSVAWGENFFVALGSGGYISTSEDGVNWTETVENENLGKYGWNSIAYNGTKFVALGSTGRISTSKDGINWEASYFVPELRVDSYGDWVSIIYDGLNFRVFSYNGCTSVSLDGVTWNYVTKHLNLGDNSWTSLCYGKNKLVALDLRGYTSTYEFQTYYSQIEYPASNDYIFDRKSEDIIFKIFDTTEYKAWEYNENGITFLGFTKSIYPEIGSVVYSDRLGNTIFNIEGLGEFSLTVNSCNYKSIQVISSSLSNNFLTMKRVPQREEISSLDLDISMVNWRTIKPFNREGYQWNIIFYVNADSRFIAIDVDGHISTSETGYSWSRVIPNLNLGQNLWFGVAYDGSKYVSIGENGYISTSTNGYDWDEATFVSNLRGSVWWAIAYGNGRFVALGRDGKTAVANSNSPYNWYFVNDSLGAYEWANIIYDEDSSRFIAISYTGYVSTGFFNTLGRMTWSYPVFNENLGNNAWGALTIRNCFNKKEYLLIGDHGYVSTSQDGINWSEAKYNPELGDNAWFSVTYGNNKYVALGYNGNISNLSVKINRDKTFDKVSKNKVQYFTIYGNKVLIKFNSTNDEMLYSSSLVIEWGDGSIEKVVNESSVLHNYQNYGYYQVKIMSESGLLPDILSISSLYSWDSILLPMVKADGISYAESCELFKDKGGFEQVCSSPFKNTLYKNLIEVFKNSALKNVVIRDIVEAQDEYFNGICSNITYSGGLQNAIFDRIRYAKGSFRNAFAFSAIRSINFNSLISAYKEAFAYAFTGCFNLTDALFPLLESIQGDSCFKSAFAHALNLVSAGFPSLKYINGDSIFDSAFDNTAVTDLYFPSLSPVNVDNGQFNGILKGNSNLKIHLPINLEGKFSAGNIYYDLPPSEE